MFCKEEITVKKERKEKEEICSYNMREVEK